MAQKRLVGSYGKLTVGAFGPDLVASEALVAGEWYLVKGIDGSASIFPTGAVVGFMWKASGGEILATDDVCQLWTADDMCDIQSFSMDWTSAEVQTTTFCDDYNVYVAGKVDITGTVEGVMTTGLTDGIGGFQSQFVDIVKQDDTQVDPADYVVTPALGSIVLAQLFVDKTTTTGEAEAFYLVPMSLTGFSASAGGEEAQTFSSPFRVAPIEGTSLAFYSYINQ